MRKDGDTVAYTADELNEFIARGDTKTDWDRLRRMTEEEIEANAAADEESQGDVIWEMPLPVSFNISGKMQLTIRLDEDILLWFKSQGRGYQTRINSVLRAYVEAHKNALPESSNRKAS